MKKITLFLLPALLFSALMLRGQNLKKPQTFLLDQDWKFHPGNAANPSLDFNFGIANLFSKSGKAENTAIDPKFNDTPWRSLDLPHDWAVELPFEYNPNFDVQSHGYKPVGGLFPETSIGWYRKHFSIAQADSGCHFAVRFDGIFRDARIWLNGHYLGRNESGYMGITCDITDYIRFDIENVLVVRVDATQYEGWFYEGAGIYRHVWLERSNPLRIQPGSLFIYTTLSGNRATVQLEAVLDNRNARMSDCSLETNIREPSGKSVAVSTLLCENIPAGNTRLIRWNLDLENPRLWSVSDPYRYRLTVMVKEGDEITDSVSLRIGIRTFRFDPVEGFFFNGEKMKIQGVCCHQDHAGVGAALPDYLQYYRIRLLKEMGVNAYRTSHNAPTPELLDACDSLGMLVLDEQRLLNSSPEYMDQFERLIRRDRNHPSVFMWSIGNEEGYLQTNSTGKRVALSLIALQQKLDPTRTCTYGADLPDYYTGINEVIPVRGFNYRQYAVADYHQRHPHQPILGTEMGSTVTTRSILLKDTVKCYLPDQDISAPWWASTAETWWTLCAAQPHFMGGFVWTGFDYRGEPTPFQWPNINSHFGIMDMCGFPKNIYYYYQSWWTDKDVLHISPHWNWKGHEGDTIRVWVNSNAETVELSLNGKSLGTQTMLRNSHLSWSVPYKPGKLVATGIKNGKMITTVMETTGEPAALVMVPDRTLLHPGKTDATVINIHLVDKQGREVPDASHLIQFSVQGDADIIGVGNGDPSSHEADKCAEGKWQRSLFNGKCQLILRSGNISGPIKIIAQTDGLPPVVTTITQ